MEGIDWLQNFNTIFQLPATRNAFAAYVIACLAGQVGNAFWMWLGKEIDCVADRFHSDPRATVKAGLTQVGAVLVFALALPFEGVPIQTAIMLGLLQGAWADSKLNKSSRREWTPQERAANTATSKEESKQ